MATAAKDEKYDFDLFTIGGGTGGVRAARFASMDYGRQRMPFQLGANKHTRLYISFMVIDVAAFLANTAHAFCV